MPNLLLLEMGLKFEPKGFPRADHAYKYGFYLPSGLTLTEPQVDIICKGLAQALEEN